MVLPLLLFNLALLGLSLLLGAAVYESVVMAPNFERDIPASIDAARAFLQRRTPAHFFRVIAPITQLLLVGSVIAAWGIPTARWPALAALVPLVLVDVITFTFHYPRLAIMFKSAVPVAADQLQRAAREWAQGNIVRVLLLLVAWLSLLHGLVKGLAETG